MFCWKCGTKLKDDAKFCSNCGAQVKRASETDNKKVVEPQRVTTNETAEKANKEFTKKSTGNKNKKFLFAGIAVVALFFIVLSIKGCNNDKKAYKAYEEFYGDFYNEHVNKGNEEELGDCGGQILLDKKGNPILAVCDITSMGKNICADVYLYEYKRGKVKEITRKTGIKTSDDGLYISTYDGKITMCTSEYADEEAVVYVLGKNGFEKEAEIVEEDYGKEPENRNKYVDFWINTIEYTDNMLYVAFFSDINDTYAFNGSNFELLLRCLAAEEPSTVLELKLEYTNVLKSEDIDRNPSFVYVEDKMIYCYDAVDKIFYYMGKLEKSEDEVDKLPKRIEGIEVELGPTIIGKRMADLGVEDIKTFEYDENSITIGTMDGEEYTIPTVYAYDITDVESTEWQVNGVISSTITVEEAKAYFDAGKIKDIDIWVMRPKPTKMYVYRVRMDIDGDFIEDVDKYSDLIEGDKSYIYFANATTRFEMIDDLLYIEDIEYIFDGTMCFKVAEDCEWYTYYREADERVETLSYEKIKEIIDIGMEDFNRSEHYTVKCVDGLVTEVYITLNQKKYFEESSSQLDSYDETRYNDAGDIIGYKNYEYDDLGRNIKVLNYDIDGNLESYQINDYLDTKNVKTLYSADGIIKSKYEYELFADTYFVTRQDSYDSDGKLQYYSIYERDAQGVLMQRSDFLEDGSLESKTVCENVNGVCRKETTYDAAGKVISIYEYDENGEIVNYECY